MKRVDGRSHGITRRRRDANPIPSDPMIPRSDNQFPLHSTISILIVRFCAIGRGAVLAAGWHKVPRSGPGRPGAGRRRL
jgi:hypothetical protein